MKRQPKKSKRGGKRPGAGRKPTGVVVLHCYPQAGTLDLLRQEAKAAGCSVGQVIDRKFIDRAFRKAHAKIFSE